MNRIAEEINQRLSLRKPLKEALNILVSLNSEFFPEDKTFAEIKNRSNQDLEILKDTIKTKYSQTFTDFERAFPSICFSIATGVGKTRLMGACIAYLYLEKRIKNFFVLAPNLTIYNKLIDDFGNSSSEKYVFKGIAEFVHNKPLIITGDNYNQVVSLFKDTEIRINIFNVSKFAREIKPLKEGDKNLMPRIKRLSEYLGQSYWEYLSGLNDLVIFMDEAHRYHATISKESINELKPILGVELTATPVDEKNRSFNNVVYEYSLARALADGLYVKNPTIATRKNFNPVGKSEEEIEKIKLEDAVSIHEDTKQELKLYSINTGNKLVKPFILVVCKDTVHAKAIYNLLISDSFYDGAYVEKVLQIDSTTRNQELIEQQFISLEQEENEIEIVIHVNMLKEGWDVTNLYTIVPLRAANASVLVEQTIGRGLRLPFGGERTGNEKVDKLTVVAHDNFNKVIAAAQDPESVLNKLSFVQIDGEQLSQRTEVITVQNSMNKRIEDEQEAVNKITDSEKKQAQQNIVDAKKLLVEVIPFFNTSSKVKKIDDILKPEVKQEVIDAIEKRLYSGQGNLFAEQILGEAKAIYETLVTDFKKNIIEIPRMDLVQGEVTAGFLDFDLDASGFSFEQLNEEIIRIGLKDKKVDVIEVKKGVYFGDPEKLLVSELINYSEVDYDSNADLLHKLAKQAIIELKNHLKEDESIDVVVFQWRNHIATRIYDQLMAHFVLHEPEYLKPNVKSFTKIEDWNFAALKNTERKDFRDESFPAVQVPKYIFGGFKKACHFEYKFDSRTEQTLSFILENDNEVLKWLRPAPNQFRIYWQHNNKIYEPDFVAETSNSIYLIESKRADEISLIEVQEKAKAAIKYCNYATEYNLANGGKPWKYVLIPHDQILKNRSFRMVINPNIL